MIQGKYCLIAFPIEGPAIYTYSIPEKFENKLKIGMRVLTPFGHRIQLGYCMEVLDEHPNPDSKYKIKNIYEIVDTSPLFSKKMLQLIHWIANYYFSSPGLVCKIAHPSEKGLKRIPVYTISQEFIDDPRLNDLPKNIEGFETKFATQLSVKNQQLVELLLKEKVIQIENTWPKKASLHKSRYFALAERVDEKLNSQQFRVIQYLETLPEKRAKGSNIRKVLNISDSPLRTLRKKNIIEEIYIEDNIDPFDNDFPLRERKVVLNDDQSTVINRLNDLKKGFHPALIHGITGSGKTEVYIQLAKKKLAEGKDVLILVPEISLTPQIAGRFRSVFKEQVSIWHSQMTSAQRLWTWKQIREGRCKIVVGARSALFSPFQDLGLIIIDEEHENSYKQESPSPRYHARDTALYYGRLLDIPVILGSATPSLESWYLIQQEKIKKYELPRRFGPAIEPSIRIADMTEVPHDGILSRMLLEEIKLRLTKGEQIILLQNRRGFNSVQHCRACGKTMECKVCSVSYTYHKSIHLLRCHYCGATQEPLQRCPSCGEPLQLRGTGTQKVEEHLHKMIPGARVIRMDHDTTQNKNAHIKILNAFENKEYDILLGTQMIAKGLDFANVTLVGIINADIGMGLPDFRSSEQLFQLISQVSGRAGRGNLKGQVIIQSYNAEAAAVAMAAKGELKSFYHQELKERKELNYPPYSRLALIRIIAKDENSVKKAANDIKKCLSKQAQKIMIMGPAAAPIERIKGMTRWQIMLKSSRERDPSAAALRILIRKCSLLEKNNKVRIQLNMDPYSML
ncbi:MAG: primosomal protein N' [Candidatus Marinimicrobia bacterium]|nr:primosomal protein N' [Candidatus Neomarinimicrobiota bacterium]